MINQVLPAKYANALFLVAKNSGQLKNVERDLCLILEVLKSNPEFEKVINHPGIDKENKKQMIKEIFTDKINDISFNLLFLLIDKKRENLLSKIYDIFREKVYEYEGVKRLTIETATALSQSEKQYFSKELEKLFRKKIYLDTRVNQGILGGIIIRDKMTMIDASLKQFLNSLKNQIRDTKIIKEKKKTKTIKKKAKSKNRRKKCR